MRVVLDTNVLISGIIHPLGASRKILEAWRINQVEIVTSSLLLSELSRVLQYPRIVKRLDESNFLKITNQLLTKAETVSGLTPTPDIIKNDPSDNVVLSCAEEGEADYIVSGDPHLLNLGSYKNIPIVTPRVFVDTILPKDN